MSGGVARVKRDRAADFGRLRRDTYGLDLAPLPLSLQLHAEEDTMQRKAQLVVPEELPQKAEPDRKSFPSLEV